VTCTSHFEVINCELVTLYLYNYNRIMFLTNMHYIINGILLLYAVTGPMKSVHTTLSYRSPSSSIVLYFMSAHAQWMV